MGFKQRQSKFAVAPDFKERIKTYQEVNAGETVTLECLLAGFPVPVVTWYKDDQVLTNEFPFKIEHDGGKHQLTIATVWKQDEGAYKCKAENKEGVSSTLGYISVKGENRSRSRSPSPRRHRNNPRAVSLSPMVSTITELSEEEREEEEYSRLPPSPVLSSLEQLRKEYKKARKSASLLNKTNKKASQRKGQLENVRSLQKDSSLLAKNGQQVIQDAVAKTEKKRDDARYESIRDAVVNKNKKGVQNGDVGKKDHSPSEEKKKINSEPEFKPTADTRQSRKRRKPRPFEVDTSRSRSMDNCLNDDLTAMHVYSPVGQHSSFETNADPNANSAKQCQKASNPKLLRSADGDASSSIDIVFKHAEDENEMLLCFSVDTLYYFAILIPVLSMLALLFDWNTSSFVVFVLFMAAVHALVCKILE